MRALGVFVVTQTLNQGMGEAQLLTCFAPGLFSSGPEALSLSGACMIMPRWMLSDTNRASISSRQHIRIVALSVVIPP